MTVSAPALDLREGLDAVHVTQLRSGEMIAYQREPAGGLLYARIPLVSSAVHDALGCFDPRSTAFDERSLGSVDSALRGRFVWAATRLRRRIRGYLMWQAEADGTWRLFGRGSGRAPDAVTTARAAVTMLDSTSRAGAARRARHVEAIERLRRPDGLYHADPVVNVEVLRFLVLTGARSVPEVAGLLEHARDQVASGAPAPGGMFTNPLCLLHAAARAWSQAGLPDPSGLAADLVPRVLAMQDESGGFGGPLSTALAVTTLIDVAYEGDELERGLAAIAMSRLRWGGWGNDDFLAGGHGSPAWTTALSVTALARGTARAGGDAW